MSEVPDQAQSAGAGQAPMAGPSAGALIRRAREEAGLHVAALAVALKVPTKRLEALEADRYDLLPDLVFARALARSVCRQLKLDPEPVLARLPQGPAHALSVEGPINEPFRPMTQGASGWKPQVSRPAVIAGVVLVLAAVAVYLVPELTGMGFGVDAPPQQPATGPSPAPAPGAPAVPGSVVEPVAPSAVPPAAPAASAPVEVPPVPVVPVPAAPVPAAPVPSAPR